MKTRKNQAREKREKDRDREKENKFSRGGTHTVTCVVYFLLLCSRTELRPGPDALSFVVWSARMTKWSPLENVRFFASAVAWST